MKEEIIRRGGEMKRGDVRRGREEAGTDWQWTGARGGVRGEETKVIHRKNNEREQRET